MMDIYTLLRRQSFYTNMKKKCLNKAKKENKQKNPKYSEIPLISDSVKDLPPF